MGIQLGVVLLICSWAIPTANASEVARLPIDRRWEALSDPAEVGYTQVLREAAEKLGSWKIWLGGVSFDGRTLARIAERSQREAVLRAIREQMRLAIDLDDFLLFVDDLLAKGTPGDAVVLSSTKGRKSGILLHPDDVFHTGPPRLYASQHDTLDISPTPPLTGLKPAKDGALLGPNWMLRYKNPSGTRAKLRALQRARPGTSFSKRLSNLMRQLKRQGASVFLTSTLRDPRRGYLMWGAYTLSQAENASVLEERLTDLEKANQEWGLGIPIRWRHPQGWKHTLHAARLMSEAYRVAYATRNGAKNSNHYGGDAADLVARALPRTLTLTAPDGSRRRFDLSKAEESRDLSLSPRLVAWVEEHFHLKKLRQDYPHWNDALDRTASTLAQSTEPGGTQEAVQ